MKSTPKSSKTNTVVSVVVGLSVAVVGYALFVTLAATPTKVIEAEDATGAKIIDDTTASQAKALLFGDAAPSTGGGTDTGGGTGTGGTGTGGVSTDTNATTCTAPTPLSGATGYKLVDCTDFAGSDIPTGWDAYEGGGDGTVVGAGRKRAQATVGGGILTLTQLADGSTGAISSQHEQKYGYWEVRMRTYATGGSGSPAHPVLLTWPNDGSNPWPGGGENDYAESDIGSGSVGVFLHCPTSSGGNCYTNSLDIDQSEWHVYGFEWTSSFMAGYIDGKEWFRDTSVQPPGPHHQTIQLDNLSGSTPVAPAKMEADWVHVYSK